MTSLSTLQPLNGPLAADEIQMAATALVHADVSDEEKARFLLDLSQRGETAEEIATFVDCFLERAVEPPLRRDQLRGPMLDVVGTGGDRLHLFNVSTTAMFILAGGGVTVTKHGNRSVTSRSGGADVLEALGVRIDLPAERVARGIEEIGVGFFFAPLYHPAFKQVAGARKLLAAEGHRSMFNLLGPLLNPARPDHQLIGVFDPAWLRRFGEILQHLPRRSAWVVHGTAKDGQGMDELSTLGQNQICALESGQLREFVIDPAELELAMPKLEELEGADADVNADILEAVLSGTATQAQTDLAVLNAAAGFVITGLAQDLKEGIQQARESIHRGAAHAALRALQSWC